MSKETIRQLCRKTCSDRLLQNRSDKPPLSAPTEVSNFIPVTYANRALPRAICASL